MGPTERCHTGAPYLVERPRDLVRIFGLRGPGTMPSGRTRS